MKYIEIDLNRAVELFRQGKGDRVFFVLARGELYRVDASRFWFSDLATEANFFEQIKEG